jgi:hypothetical protein
VNTRSLTAPDSRGSENLLISGLEKEPRHFAGSLARGCQLSIEASAFSDRPDVDMIVDAARVDACATQGNLVGACDRLSLGISRSRCGSTLDDYRFYLGVFL